MVQCMGMQCTFEECVNAPCHAGVVANDLYDVRAMLLDLAHRYERDPGNVVIQQEIGVAYLRLQQLDRDRRRLDRATPKEQQRPFMGYSGQFQGQTRNRRGHL